MTKRERLYKDMKAFESFGEIQRYEREIQRYESF
jgi:hypothetical protein